MKFEITHRYTGAVLFSLECGSLKVCVEAAVKARANLADAYLAGAHLAGANLAGAYLARANLADAYLADAYLADAYLDGAYLAGAYLDGAYLDGAYLAGAYLARANLAGAHLAGANLAGANLADANLDGKFKPATPEEAIANLDKVREIILDNKERLHMGHWHGGSGWQERTCAEEAICGTTHCLAGWLQVCATEPELKKLEPHIAGYICAPVAAKMFYKGDDETLAWLRNREYALAATE